MQGWYDGGPFNLLSDLPKGEYVMTVFHFSLHSESLSLAPAQEFRMNFMVGDETSKETVEAKGTVAVPVAAPVGAPVVAPTAG